MKKITLTLLVLCFTLVNLSAQEQILLQEDFNDGFPQNWFSNPFQGNNQWVIPPLGGNSLDGSDMMYIQAFPNQQTITELQLPSLPPADPMINVVMMGFTFNQRAEQNTQLKIVQFDDMNPGVPIELEVLNLTSCDPINPWNCAPDYFDIFIEIPNYDHNDQFVLVYEDFDQSGIDFFALDNIFIWGFNNCPIGLILDVNFPPTCHNGNDAALHVTGVLGEPPYQYSLDGGALQGSGQFSTTPGAHTVTVVDNLGCMKTYTFEVPNAPAMSLQTTTFPPTCFNGNNAQIQATASGGTPPYFYSLDGAAAVAQGNFTTTPSAHVITVTDAQGCIETFNINVPNTPDMVVNLVHTNVLLCFGDVNGTATANVTSGGTAPYQYSLDGGPFGPNGTFNGLGAGDYAITVRDANNCTRIENFTINEPAPLVVNAILVDLSCWLSADGVIDPTIVGGTPPYETQLDGGAWTPAATYTNLSGGMHTLEVRDANLCQLGQSYTLEQPLPLVSDTIALTPSTGNDGAIDVETTGGNSPYIYLWSNGETSQDLENLSSGDYWLLTTDQENCLSDTLFVTVPSVTAVHDIPSSAVEILGNPAQDFIVIQLSDYFISNDRLVIELIDLSGIVRLKKEALIDGGLIHLPVSQLNDGIYLLTLSYGETRSRKILTKKIMVRN